MNSCVLIIPAPVLAGLTSDYTEEHMISKKSINLFFCFFYFLHVNINTLPRVK